MEDKDKSREQLVEELAQMRRYLAALEGSKGTRGLTEDALWEGGEYYRLLVESVKDYAIFMLDPEGRVTTWNEGAQRIKGYRTEEIVGEHFSIFYLPEDIERGHPEEVLRRAMEESSYEEERLRVRKDGSRFWASVVITALWEEGGDLRGFAKVVRDITERKRSEQTQRWQVELLELSYEPILAWELGGAIVYWNRGCEEIYGFSREEAVGSESHRLLQTVHPVSLERFEAELERDGRWVGELEHTARDGRSVVVESRHELVETTDGRRLVQETNRDITDRRRAEEASREGRERLRFALDAARMGSWELDLITGTARRSLGHDQIFGYEEPLPEWGYDLFLEHVHSEDRSFVQQRFDAAARTEGHWEFECRIFRTDGALRWIWARGTPYRDEHGRPVRFLGGVIDITERKEAEEELRHSSERVTNILESITDAFFALDKEWRFTYLNRQAERILRRPREELLGKNQYEEFPEAVGSKFQEKYYKAVESGISVHFEEFYAPLGIWVEQSAYPSDEGLSVYFRDVTERKRTEEALRETREAERRRISRDLHDVVLQDLSGALQTLQLARLRAGRLGSDLDLEEEIEALRRAAAGLRNAVYDLRRDDERPLVHAVEALVSSERRRAPEREIDLSVQEGFPQELAGTVGTELLRVIREALTNVRRHSGSGHTEVSLGAEGGQMWVEVADDGRGFDPGDTSETPGGGAGLPGMRERVEALGGQFEIRTRPGEGVRVTARVPF